MLVRQLPLNKTAKQRGLSVVELLISLVIGMAVIAGSIQVVVSSKRSFMDQDEVSFIQANARYALDLMGKDIRMAGYLGCATKNSVQLANSIDSDFGGYISLHGLRGFDGETDTSNFPADFKARVGASWARRGFTGSAYVNHLDAETGSLEVGTGGLDDTCDLAIDFGARPDAPLAQQRQRRSLRGGGHRRRGPVPKLRLVGEAREHPVVVLAVIASAHPVHWLLLSQRGSFFEHNIVQIAGRPASRRSGFSIST